MSGHLEHKDGNHRRDSVQENLNAACLVTQALGTTFTSKAFGTRIRGAAVLFRV